MGVSKIQCATMQGFDAQIVDLEIAFVKGLPAFNITGLAHQSVQESKHRSSSALAAIGFSFPPLKININLSPSDLPKQGSHFDLPIALLIALFNVEISPLWRGQYFAVGELGLDGKIKATDSIYSILLDLSYKCYQGIIFAPKEQWDIYQKIPHLKILAMENLQEILDLFTQKQPIALSPQVHDLGFDHVDIQGVQYYFKKDFKEDFKDIKGQKIAKRAALIAASGFHNILLEGSPGCGKSMIAKRMRYILPPVTQEEILKNAKMKVYEGKALRYSHLRPFRSPHASSSKAALLGSSMGYELKVGEIALASQGILFLDELPHFSMPILEALREPLENHSFTLSRAKLKVEYETKFLLVCAQNPCPCGNLMSEVHECRCSDQAIIKYKNRLSEPFLDRIDLYVSMQEIKEEHTITSNELFDHMMIAFTLQKNRQQPVLNGHLNDAQVETFCHMTDESQQLLTQAVQTFGLSYRSSTKLKKVARTIADLESSDVIQKKHLIEALSFRRR